MKTNVTAAALMLALGINAQTNDKKDTTRVNIGDTEVILISHKDEESVDKAPVEEEKEKVFGRFQQVDWKPNQN